MCSVRAVSSLHHRNRYPDAASQTRAPRAKVFALWIPEESARSRVEASAIPGVEAELSSRRMYVFRMYIHTMYSVCRYVGRPETW